MPNTLRIKRRASTGAAGAPSSLANAELAFNEADNTLYYGKGTGGAGGTATTIEAIAGSGAYVTLGTTQTVSGIKTFNSPCVFSGTGTNSATGVTQSSSDDSTRLATTAYVKSVVSAVGGGTVTSVALSLPDLFTVSGSPVTGSGTLTATLASQTAAQVFAAPAATAGAPTFRALVAGDIPALTAAKISDFDTQVRTSRLDQMAAPTVSVAFNSQRITGLADPSGAQDAATKAYVDAISQGLDVKQSVRAATTANITLSAPQTIDGVSVIAGDRVLVKNQSTGSQNGIYVVAASAWTRAADANSATNLTAGAFTFVEEGTVNADSGWVLTTNSPITIDTTGLTFAQFSGAGQVVAGAGLTKTGNTLDVGGTASRIVVNADTIDIAGDYVGQNTITTVGSITTGTWSATAITATRGGTGLTTVPKGSVLIANTLDTISALDGGGSVDGILAYDAASDTISWAITIDGGTF
jgi:hypothetical protein